MFWSSLVSNTDIPSVKHSVRLCPAFSSSLHNSAAVAGAPEEHHVMAKYKQPHVRLPTEYKGIDVEVKCLLACFKACLQT